MIINRLSTIWPATRGDGDGHMATAAANEINNALLHMNVLPHDLYQSYASVFVDNFPHESQQPVPLAAAAAVTGTSTTATPRAGVAATATATPSTHISSSLSSTMAWTKPETNQRLEMNDDNTIRRGNPWRKYYKGSAGQAKLKRSLPWYVRTAGCFVHSVSDTREHLCVGNV
jgi:hypothetical protein